ncbi:MAG: hypothetical protein IPG45_15890 [Deltaproteobacteria bacterium]|nr:hypothetical protein [Deltaproteobacteria bacterium]
MVFSGDPDLLEERLELPRIVATELLAISAIAAVTEHDLGGALELGRLQELLDSESRSQADVELDTLSRAIHASHIIHVKAVRDAEGGFRVGVDACRIRGGLEVLHRGAAATADRGSLGAATERSVGQFFSGFSATLGVGTDLRGGDPIGAGTTSLGIGYRVGSAFTASVELGLPVLAIVPHLRLRLLSTGRFSAHAHLAFAAAQITKDPVFAVAAGGGVRFLFFRDWSGLRELALVAEVAGSFGLNDGRWTVPAFLLGEVIL